MKLPWKRLRAEPPRPPPLWPLPPRRPPLPPLAERMDTAERQFALALEHKGEKIACLEMRKHLAWYTAGMPHSARFRQTINSMETFGELIAGVETIFG